MSHSHCNIEEDEEAYAGNFYRNLLPANYNFDLAWLGTREQALTLSTFLIGLSKRREIAAAAIFFQAASEAAKPVRLLESITP